MVYTTFLSWQILEHKGIGKNKSKYAVLVVGNVYTYLPENVTKGRFAQHSY